MAELGAQSKLLDLLPFCKRSPEETLRKDISTTSPNLCCYRKPCNKCYRTCTECSARECFSTYYWNIVTIGHRINSKVLQQTQDLFLNDKSHDYNMSQEVGWELVRETSQMTDGKRLILQRSIKSTCQSDLNNNCFLTSVWYKFVKNTHEKHSWKISCLLKAYSAFSYDQCLF